MCVCVCVCVLVWFLDADTVQEAEPMMTSPPLSSNAHLEMLKFQKEREQQEREGRVQTILAYLHHQHGEWGTGEKLMWAIEQNHNMNYGEVWPWTPLEKAKCWRALQLYTKPLKFYILHCALEYFILIGWLQNSAAKDFGKMALTIFPGNQFPTSHFS